MPLSNNKKKVGIFGLTGCGGDQLAIIHAEDELLNLFESLDIRSFSMADSSCSNDNLDIALVEGSVSSREQAQHVKDIRKRTAVLIAMGTCACYGGIQAMDPERWDQRFRKVYGGESFINSTPVVSQAVDSCVKVDFYLPGCPIDIRQCLTSLAHVVRGTEPVMPDYPVCAECRWKENDCLLLHGILCLGPVTAAGCGAACPSRRLPCMGCWGSFENGNITAQYQVLTEKGYPEKEIRRRMHIFAGKGLLDPVKEQGGLYAKNNH